MSVQGRQLGYDLPNGEFASLPAECQPNCPEVKHLSEVIFLGSTDRSVKAVFIETFKKFAEIACRECTGPIDGHCALTGFSEES